MATLLSLVGFVVLVISAIGVVKGGVPRAGLAGRKQSCWGIVAALAIMATGGAVAPAQEGGQGPTATPAGHEIPAGSNRPSPERAASPVASPSRPGPTRLAQPQEASATPSRVVTAAPATSSLGPLLLMASGGDGDSWHDTRGTEYRMGLVNTPETNECGGSTATTYRKRRLRSGFHARVYSTDAYGRKVAVIYTPDGTNLNVAMAREGIANDKYLATYRYENPGLARELDRAFALAKARRVGIWGRCATGDAPTGAGSTDGGAVAPAPAPASGCHPDYRTCVPVKGDGSGEGGANDLDCGDIRKVVYLRVIGADPYRLDANDDGVGCESYG